VRRREREGVQVREEVGSATEAMSSKSDVLGRRLSRPVASERTLGPPNRCVVITAGIRATCGVQSTRQGRGGVGRRWRERSRIPCAPQGCTARQDATARTIQRDDMDTSIRRHEDIDAEHAMHDRARQGGHE
jgi:hypothetical protein